MDGAATPPPDNPNQVADNNGQGNDNNVPDNPPIQPAPVSPPNQPAPANPVGPPQPAHR